MATERVIVLKGKLFFFLQMFLFGLIFGYWINYRRVLFISHDVFISLCLLFSLLLFFCQLDPSQNYPRR